MYITPKDFLRKFLRPTRSYQGTDQGKQKDPKDHSKGPTIWILIIVLVLTVRTYHHKIRTIVVPIVYIPRWQPIIYYTNSLRVCQ